MLSIIEKEIQSLKEIQKCSRKVIEEAPEGNLRCAINKGCYQYYCGKKYLGNEKKEYIKQIAQKEYCLKLNRQIERYLQKLRELQELYENNSLEEIYRTLHPARKCLIKPFIKPREEIVEEFENKKYQGKSFAEDDITAYFTMKGERVRSKSEKIIADELFRYDVPYKYEMPIELRDRKRKIKIYPDFTALNRRTGKLWLIEHLGMMDRLSYSENAMHKLDIYEKNDLLIGENLILLHETSGDPLSTIVLRKYIEKYLL